LGNYDLSAKLRKSGCSEEQAASMREQLQPQLKTIVEKIKLGEPAKLREQYQNVVNGLAKVDPILAHMISGRAGIEKFLDMKEVMFDKAGNHVGISATENKPLRVDDILNQTQKDIYSIAWRIGYITFVRVFFTLKRSEKRLQQEINKELQQEITKELDEFV